MTLNEAEKILRSWQDFMEIADKFFRLQFQTLFCHTQKKP